ncbi:hypothetical protein N656DRAFT_141307 [Canariomyces notabilis]|uniref:Uncharacterized protein n=1 Tax=Canariomyces notabilis TaxID=2074819 RepID=A0AAN6TC05_9PEZI|nr:hypothetical protein N656DRAFT_141307 [Canariomyces arenarius]
MNSSRVEEIIRSLEYHHEQYIKNLRLLQEVHSNASVRATRLINNDVTASPLIKAVSFGQVSAQSTGSLGARRLTNDSPTTQPSPVSDAVEPAEEPPFLPLTPPIRSNSARTSETIVPSVQRPLLKETFSEEGLLIHLRSIGETNHDTITALGEVWQKRDELDISSVFTGFETGEGSPYANATYEILEIGMDSIPRHKQIQSDQGFLGGAGDGDGDNQDSSVWRVLKDINADGDAVGRITILQEPTPLMLAATHMSMQQHFDMDELFQHLVSTTGNKGKTKAYMDRAFETADLRQRSFFFVFKYYTVVGEGLTPAPWQAFDHRPPDRKSPDHIDITECSSILALSLGGDPTGTVKVKVKRKTRSGLIYDTFAPWHLLNIQCFPDDQHSTRSDDSKKHFFNGPYAFLDALCIEYRDAVKRYTYLNEMITKLITPPNQFMFDVRLRDKLLFEDSNFTYSRRYFWAYNTLGVINEGIKSMRSAYLSTFTKDFWAGRHPTLWPHPNPDSTEGRDYAARMDILRQDLESAVADLQLMYEKNETTRTEIRSLREQLFSGSSVKESRRAIEQGDNIKILTNVSMIFLPLTFVVGVFGITEFDISPEDWRFAVTLVSVCIPFFILILVLVSPQAPRYSTSTAPQRERKIKKESCDCPADAICTANPRGDANGAQIWIACRRLSPPTLLWHSHDGRRRGWRRSQAVPPLLPHDTPATAPAATVTTC